jgi:hypothetical protein
MRRTRDRTFPCRADLAFAAIERGRVMRNTLTRDELLPLIAMHYRRNDRAVGGKRAGSRSILAVTDCQNSESAAA